jgi:plasmid stabilization system protein ParE
MSKTNRSTGAEADITSAVVWYESMSVARQCFSKFACDQSRLSRPRRILQLRSQPAVHRILVRRFPYRIFYITRPDALVVFAVIHVSRHDSRWLRRITP